MSNQSTKEAFMKDFIKAQKEMRPAIKEAKNPRFNSKYSDISSVLNACMEALYSNNLAMTQPVEHKDIGMVVTTRITHITGEYIETSLPLIMQKNDMQGLGSAITYARRYGLTTLLGIPEDDDDGNSISIEKKEPKSINQEQLKRIENAFNFTGLTDWEKTYLNDLKARLEMYGNLFESQLKKLKEIEEQKGPKKKQVTDSIIELVQERTDQAPKCPEGKTHMQWLEDYTQRWGGLPVIEQRVLDKGGKSSDQWDDKLITQIINKIHSGEVKLQEIEETEKG